MYNRMHYKLTTPIDPNDPKRTFKDLVFPTMNQTSEDILTRTMMDPYTSNWFNVYFYGMLKRNNATLTAAQQMFRHLTFDRIEDYLAVYNFMMPLQEVRNPLLILTQSSVVQFLVYFFYTHDST